MIALIPPIATVLAFASDASSECVRDELWTRLQTEYPEPILEEVLGLTKEVQREIGFDKTSDFVQKMMASGLRERWMEWRKSWWLEELDFWIYIASDTKVSHDVLDILARDDDADVRAEVAGNQSTPSDILSMLAVDFNEEVRWNAGGNPNTNLDVLRLMAGDSDAYIRWSVARNHSTPKETLRTLSKDSDAYVRWKAAGNPSTPSDSLELLMLDRDTDVRIAATKNPSRLKNQKTSRRKNSRS